MLSPEFLAIGGGSSGYAAKNSLRFRASNSAYLERTPAGAGNRKTWTWSAWVKRGTLGGAVSMNLFVGNRAGTTDATYTDIVFTPSDQFAVRGYATNWRITTAVFRDPSAWYHLVVALDTTQATAADRVKVYVNGTQITSFGTSNNPALNADLAVNAALPQSVGRDVSGGGTFFDGHMAHVYLIDGQALTPSSFGRTDAATGEWVPTNYSGSYGTNGFRLSFEDAASTTTIGYDSSGAANHMTTSGVSVTAGTTFDQMTDTPTLNYCVLNPVNPTGSTLSNANLSASIPFATNSIVKGTFSASSGKWYWEVTVTSGGVGTVGALVDGAAETYYPGYTSSDGISYPSGGGVYRGGAPIQTYNSFTTNDVIGVALDLDNGKIFFSKNGTWQGSSDPAAGTNPAASTGIAGKTWNVANGNNSASAAGHAFNFGARPFAYSPPTGFAALNTRNLPTPSIKRSRQYFDTRLRTGTGAAASVADLEFAPDLVWIKSRSAATTHNLFDTSRGAQKGVQTTGPNAEFTDANSLSAFGSNGYSLGTDASSRGVNVNTATYFDWALKSGSAPGFNITLFTGDGTGARTINHGLGVTPQLMLVRGRDARVWAGWHKNLTSAAYYVDLGTVAAEAVDTTMFDSAAPGASSFRVGSYNNANLVNYLAYLFTEVPGFSRIGVYTGNASTDGPFVWCGFKPKFVMVKARDAATGWFIANPSNSANEVIQRVFADGANAEASNIYGLDLLAGGFKVRAPTGYSLNNSGISYLFIAFAEVPFKYARAR
jgi:hypothetical protein